MVFFEDRTIPGPEARRISRNISKQGFKQFNDDSRKVISIFVAQPCFSVPGEDIADIIEASIRPRLHYIILVGELIKLNISTSITPLNVYMTGHRLFRFSEKLFDYLLEEGVITPLHLFRHLVFWS